MYIPLKYRKAPVVLVCVRLKVKTTSYGNGIGVLKHLKEVHHEGVLFWTTFFKLKLKFYKGGFKYIIKTGRKWLKIQSVSLYFVDPPL